MQRRTVLTILAVALGAAGAAALAVMVTTTTGEPSESGTADGWSGRAILCSPVDEPDQLRDLEPGAVHDLGDEPSELLERSRCRTVEHPNNRDTPPDVHEGRSYFVLGTGDDRYDVTLVEVVAAGTSATLRAEHLVGGASCGRTDDYRGELLLLIEGPVGATTPSVDLDEVGIDC